MAPIVFDLNSKSRWQIIPKSHASWHKFSSCQPSRSHVRKFLLAIMDGDILSKTQITSQWWYSIYVVDFRCVYLHLIFWIWVIPHVASFILFSPFNITQSGLGSWRIGQLFLWRWSRVQLIQNYLRPCPIRIYVSHCTDISNGVSLMSIHYVGIISYPLLNSTLIK